MPKIRGSCLNCGGAPTIDAHLFPDAFIKDIRAGGPKIAIADPDGGAFKTSPSGEYDAAILCAVCDGGVLGPVEQAAIEWTRHRKTMSHNHIERVTVPGDGNALIRFAAGICWKYSVAHERFDRPYAGPHLDTLRATAFGSAAPPPTIDLCVAGLLSGGGGYFFNKPVLRDVEGVDVIQFVVGGFVWFLKVDTKHSPRLCAPLVLGIGGGDPSPPLELFLSLCADGYATWLRDKREIEYQTLPLILTLMGRCLLEHEGAEKSLALRRYLKWH